MRIVITSQRVDEFPARGERRDALDQGWTMLLARMELVLLPMPNRVTDAAGLADAVNATALILTGGNAVPGAPDDDAVAPERDATERRLLEWAMRERCPVLAVCRGFQFVNVFLGGRLDAVSGHVGTTHDLRWQDKAHDGLRALHRVNSFHRAGISRDDLAPDLVPMAWAPDGSIEVARHGGFPIWGLMWHPERSPELGPQTVSFLRQHLTNSLP